MSHSVHAGAPVATAGAFSEVASLRTLYYARFVFALVWAGLLALTASNLGPVSVSLLVLYPLVDVAAAGFDLRSSGAARSRTALSVNMALSLLAAIALAVAAVSGIPTVLRVWGAWAIAAGLVQLTLAIQRYRLGGQTPMILSGAISTLAGAGFLVMAAAPEASLAGLAGYATLGGLFFLISATRVHRAGS